MSLYNIYRNLNWKNDIKLTNTIQPKDEPKLNGRTPQRFVYCKMMFNVKRLEAVFKPVIEICRPPATIYGFNSVDDSKEI